jgi:hypothetical protein
MTLIYDSSDGTLQEQQQQRRRSRYVIEDTKGIYDIYNNMQQQEKKNKSVPLPPENVFYSSDFLHL